MSRGGDVLHERVLRGEDHVGGAVEGVRSGGKDGDLVTLDVEVDFGTGGFANPVFLQKFDGFGPVKGLKLVDEAISVFGDAQHPLA